MLCIFLFSHIADVLLAHRRHEQEVAEVCTARSTQSGVGESIYGIILVIITGAGIPAVNTGVRSRLNHAIGHHGTRMGVTVTSSSDEWVNEHGIILFFQLTGRAGCQYGCGC